MQNKKLKNKNAKKAQNQKIQSKTPMAKILQSLSETAREDIAGNVKNPKLKGLSESLQKKQP
jgi:hypothetical protein